MGFLGYKEKGGRNIKNGVPPPLKGGGASLEKRFVFICVTRGRGGGEGVYTGGERVELRHCSQFPARKVQKRERGGRGTVFSVTSCGYKDTLIYMSKRLKVLLWYWATPVLYVSLVSVN